MQKLKTFNFSVFLWVPTGFLSFWWAVLITLALILRHLIEKFSNGKRFSTLTPFNLIRIFFSTDTLRPFATHEKIHKLRHTDEKEGSLKF